MDTRATLRQVPSLAAPIATGLIARITITNHPLGGPLFVGGASALDSASTIPEPNEANNSASRTFTVLGNKVQ